jgi:ubiquinone/menaquinone biosynthesis C-methylase UbiE
LRLIKEILSACPGGNLLDAGCGPGVMVRDLLESRPGDFRITVLDQSPAMVEYCTAQVRDVGEVQSSVGELGAMPFAGDQFDVTLAMGVLEYTDSRVAIRDLARVTRPGGLVIVSMLNPLSPFRLTQWFLYWPLVRMAGAVEKVLGVPAGRRHAARRSGIRALPPAVLRRQLRQAGLEPVDTLYFDATLALPRLDRLAIVARMAERASCRHTVVRGWRRWLGTGYVVTARESKR